MNRFGLLSVILLTTTTGAFARSPSDRPEPAATLQPAASDTTPIVNEADFDVPVEALWKVFTTDEGYRKLGVAKARIDLRIGGLIQTHYKPEGVLGDEGTIQQTIIAYDPLHVLAFRISKPPQGFPFPEAWRSMWSVATFTDLGGGRSHLRFACLGFTRDDESQRLRAFFARGNGWVIAELKRNLSPDPFVAHLDSALARLVRLHAQIQDLHPLLARLQPIAVTRGDELFVFDADSSGSYTLRTRGPAPFPMPRGIRASFPLSIYDDKPTCVVSPEVFDDLAGCATIFHEFVHCAQFQTVEPRLKDRLQVARAAMRNREYSWELDHKFPYADPTFVKDYTAFLAALEKSDARATAAAVQALRAHLSPTDYEYMVWEEWKEGLARLIENWIRERMGLRTNDGGAAPPYDRVAFYRGGELYIDNLTTPDPALLNDTEALFTKMLGR